MTEKSKEDLSAIVNVDLPEVGLITKEIVGTSAELAQNGRYLVGDVRIATGRIWTTEKYEAWRQIILNTPLP